MGAHPPRDTPPILASQPAVHANKKRPRPSSPTSSSTPAPKRASSSKAISTVAEQQQQQQLDPESIAGLKLTDDKMANERATSLFSQLSSEWSKGQSMDSSKVSSLLAQLKIELSELGLLFPIIEDKSKLNLDGLRSAREVLEIGAFHSIHVKNVPAFERYLSLLSTFYADLADVLPASSNQPALTALSLLRLLAQNRIAEFHSLLETLPRAILESHEVGWVTNIERSLMEGAYSRVWRLCDTKTAQLPRGEFAFFTDSLVETVRTEIAACHERAYASLRLADARTMLFFENDTSTLEFARKRGWNVDLKAGVIYFSAPPTATSSSGTSTPASLMTGGAPALESAERELNKEKVVISALAYAKELESIV